MNIRKKYIVNVMCRSMRLEKIKEIDACIKAEYGVIVLDKDPTLYDGLPIDHFISCDVTEIERTTAEAIIYKEKLFRHSRGSDVD